ncbi:alpha/beta hydrolase [Mobilitalea sibirica]|uniref:Alpha/beta hydrolase n=1 Tax=Mobilitalea sibirica TaxID=1462919 RepID=A0A8J7GXK8_9FIRM|nr:alpha/beta hydrolase [Mobilitalea sibirica]MBH1939969.1 alpha/beta hydrolase [Mobilitalea sibirica]
MYILGIIATIIATLMLIGFIINSIKSKGELKKIKPYGQLVDVGGNKMHVYSMGEGNETIVLLPGLGVPLPSADFAPLMRELSKYYTVVTLEYFGVGFSEGSSVPRTNENYTQEIRTALQKTGFAPPYILMPHSASGIYCEYYASRYPDEIKGIVMLDTTSTAETKLPNVPRFVYSIAKFQQAIGLTRLTIGLIPEKKRIENGYTQKEINDYKTRILHNINDTFINQSVNIVDNIKEVYNLAFPKNVPVLKLISSQTIKYMAKKNKDDGMGYQNKHLHRLGEHTTYQIIDSSHFLYQDKALEIVDYTEDFLKNINQ